jgi:hypothetical protein
MSIFKKPTKSVTCIVLTHKIIVNDKEIEQTQYLTENYVYTEANGKKLIYLPRKNNQYLVDTQNKQLKEVDLSAQMAQINQLKAMVGEVDMQEKEEAGARLVTLQNNTNSPVQLIVKLKTKIVESLGKTVFKEFYEFQQNMQMYHVNLNSNETVQFTESVFTINGQEQKSTVELTATQNGAINIETIDGYLNYKIVK